MTCLSTKYDVFENILCMKRQSTSKTDNSGEIEGCFSDQQINPY
jgi:hypothetical protein